MLSSRYKIRLVIGVFLLSAIAAKSQLVVKGEDSAYIKVVTERSAKIVAPLGLDSLHASQATMMVANQYRSLNRIYEEQKGLMDAQKQKPGLSKEDKTVSVKRMEDNRDSLVKKQHAAYLKTLSTILTPAQVEQVKNGMTYNLVNVTYDAYVDMIPTLKEAEKQKIHGWLVEARELAMDAESADKKHAVFGKYKGRINNYLSAQGYDSKKEREAWEARIKAKKDAAKSSN